MIQGTQLRVVSGKRVDRFRGQYVYVQRIEARARVRVRVKIRVRVRVGIRVGMPSPGVTCSCEWTERGRDT